MSEILCSRCVRPLNEEEAENSRTDEDGDGEPLCDECWHNEYEFTCCDCQNYGHVRDQHKMLVVFERVYSMGGPDRYVSPGIYKIDGRGAYYGGPLIGEGWIYGDRLTRIGDVKPDMDCGGYPCGHLCKECQTSVEEELEGMRR